MHDCKTVLDCLAIPFMQVNSLRSHNPNGGISIRERQPAAAAEPSQPASAEEKQQQADADYARQLQAKLDAQEARGGNKSDGLPSRCFVVTFSTRLAHCAPDTLWDHQCPCDACRYPGSNL